MADDKSTVLGIRLDTEERKRFDDFVSEEGKNNKTFLDTLLNLYELNKGKAKNINLVGDIETLEGYTNKIQQAFINVIEKLESQKGDILENSQKDLQIYKEKVNDLQNEVDTIKSLNSTNEEKLTKVNSENISLNTLCTELQKDMKEKTEQLQQGLQDKIIIIEEYKGKNDMLLGQLKQYEKYPEQLENIRGLLADAEKRESENEKLLEKEKVRSEKYLSDYNLEVANRIKDINKLNSDHSLEIEVVKEKAAFNTEKALLNKDREDQVLINKINQENNEKIKELLHDNQEHNEKISKLMEENQLKSSEINGQDMKIKELIVQVENLKELNKAKEKANQIKKQ